MLALFAVGPIPLELENLAELEHLYLRHNQLTGEVFVLEFQDEPRGCLRRIYAQNQLYNPPSTTCTRFVRDTHR